MSNSNSSSGGGGGATLELLEPACSIRVGLRTHRQQRACANTEQQFGLGAVCVGGVVALACLIYKKKITPTTVAILAASGTFAVAGTYFIREVRMRQWVARRTSLASVLESRDSYEALRQLDEDRRHESETTFAGSLLRDVAPAIF